jgi:predicted Zn-dependent peptidase
MKRLLIVSGVVMFLGTSEITVFASDFSLSVGRHRFDNGLQLLTIEDHSAPVITYYTFYRVGSRNERPGITGLSHYFEHMMFNGAAKYGPKEFDRVLESNGGYSNAFTSNDMTAYYEDFAAANLELVLQLESDRMHGLLFDPEVMESERGVVSEERRVGVDNDPYGAVDEMLFATAYLAHPYHWPVVGWMADIQSYTREQCLEYFRTYYAPNNATVIIAGDFETAQAVELVDRYLGGLEPGPPPDAVVRSEPLQRGERRSELRMPAEVPLVAAAYHVPAAESDDAVVLDVLRSVMAAGESSRLQKALVFEQEIALDVYVDYYYRLDPNLMYFLIDVNPDSSSARAEAALQAELDRLVREPVSPDELATAKSKLLASFYRDLKTNNGRAEQAGMYDLWFNDYARLFEVPARIEKVSAADIQRVAGACLQPDNRTVVTLVPTSGD